MNVSSIKNSYTYNKPAQSGSCNIISSKNTGVNPSTNEQINAGLASDGHVSTQLYTEFVHRLGYTDYHVYNGTPISAYTEQFGRIENGYQVLAKFNLTNRKEHNERIKSFLEENGIKFSPDEKLTITIDKNACIWVSGSTSKERDIQIQQALNSSDKSYRIQLMRHIYAINELNGKLNTLEYDKWEVGNLLEEQTGQRLQDLELMNGEITGANDKLAYLLNSSPDTQTYEQRVLVKKLRTVMEYGAGNIPDMKLGIDFINGSLVDRDAKYGFGPEQLKGWFNDVVSGRTAMDVKI
ncbi:MAG: DUF4885 domain-containing protein [Clostridia bacterium]|nr:DUF4885 domain-containing protein [Clostridia bacterium]